MSFQNTCYICDRNQNIPKMEIKGFKPVSYEELQTALEKRNDDKKIPDVNMAVNIGVKNVGTIRNAFSTKEQLVSDKVLTNIFKELEIQAAIVWINGERNYYLSTKN